ncbi:MAG: LytTR family DNA-binding domain-containing protein [Deltaproteobacteria bacterium]|jgi:two-component system LytT family response regulator
MRVLIVDDEAMARRRLRRLLDANPDVELAGECQDGAEVPQRVAAGDVDLVLLDIQMRQMSGVEVMGLLPSNGPLVVFVTAHPEHAVYAFDAGAVDYVVKPVEAGRLQKALGRARERIAARALRGGEDEAQTLPDRLLVPTRNGLRIIAPEQVRYAIVDGQTVLLHTDQGSFVTDFRLVALEERLGAPFVRVHRRVLANVHHIVALEPVGAGVYVAELSDGQTVPVSRQSAKILRARWSL